jgi:hypothetical protein
MNNRFVIDSCLIINNGRHGIYSDVQRFGSVINSIIANNTTHGFYSDHDGTTVGLSGNIFYGNGDHAINVNYMREGLCSANLFVANTGYGINIRSAHGSDIPTGNAFFNNTSGQINGLTGIDSITLTADPFVDPTASPPDFNLNSDAGGGSTLRANNFALNTDTSIYPFRQYVSDDFDSGAGGGGATVHPLRSN